jgi:hypothetical protein
MATAETNARQPQQSTVSDWYPMMIEASSKLPIPAASCALVQSPFQDISVARALS